MRNSSATLLAGILLAACTSSPTGSPMAPAKPDAPERVCGKQFMIFFSFGEPTITAEADEALRSYVDMIREFAPTRVKLAGHTDTLETDPSALSAARVDLVARRLRELGVTAEIQTRSAGSSEPEVQTPPNTKEAQNRRVTIDY
jgi:outer membrane protein OmpA-like peptidoglycan-associated protein